MPLTEKGEEIRKNMENQYGKEKGEKVFYASENAGTITGVHEKDAAIGMKGEMRSEGETMSKTTTDQEEFKAPEQEHLKETSAEGKEGESPDAPERPDRPGLSAPERPDRPGVSNPRSKIAVYDPGFKNPTVQDAASKQAGPSLQKMNATNRRYWSS